MKSVKSIRITFADGSSREVITQSDTDEAFYKSESLPGDLLDHYVYVVGKNVLVRDTPKFGLD